MRIQPIFLLVMSALLLAIIALSSEFELWAMILFIGVHIWMLVLFALEPLPDIRDWILLWSVLAGMTYLLFFILLPRTIGIEILGFILCLVYLVAATFIGFYGVKLPTVATVDDIKKKDDLDELIDSFEISRAPDVIEDDVDEESELDIEDNVKIYSSKTSKPVYSYETEQEVTPVDVTALKEDVDKFDTEVSKLSEKIRNISEAALSADVVVKEGQVFATKSGSKYHKSRECISLRRADEVITYDNQVEARKKGLRACELCR